jgi:hypothetical protein
MCPHGGRALFVPTNSKVLLGGMPALTSNDVTTIIGCAFTVVLKPQPCVLIRWLPGTNKLSAGGTQVLTMESKGICYSAEQLPQGSAVIINPGQMLVTA